MTHRIFKAMINKKEKIQNEINSLERNIKNGDISSCFQLYQLYKNGKSEKNSQGEYEVLLEQNPTLAEKYLATTDELLHEFEDNEGMKKLVNKLYIPHLTLVNFRRFKSLKVKFDKQLTVFIGDNGAGKTTIADALTKPLSVISANLIKQGRRGNSILEFDVNIDSLTGSEIHSQIKLGKSDYDNIFYKAPKGKSKEQSQRTEIQALEELGSLYRTLNEKRIKDSKIEVNLPLFKFYSVNRTNVKSNQTFDIEKLADIKPSSRFDLYEATFKKDSKDDTFEDFLEWFIIIDNLAGDNLKLKSEKIEKRIKAFIAAGVTEESHELWPLLLTAKEEYNETKNEYKKKSIYIKQRELIKKAITVIIPSFKDIFIDRSSGRAELKVNNDGSIINIFQGSQGQKALVSMIADIARRLVMLNPDIDNPFEGQGVILIDEIELHLHPGWQQNIIKSLLDTFPNIQFIITTHSPQVLSTVDKSCIRQFIEDEDSNFIALPPKFQTKGVKSADILELIMHINSTPDVEAARDVDEFLSTLLTGKKEEALQLLSKLINHFGEDHPVILNCRNEIKIYEMKERMSKRFASREVK